MDDIPPSEQFFAPLEFPKDIAKEVTVTAIGLLCQKISQMRNRAPRSPPSMDEIIAQHTADNYMKHFLADPQVFRQAISMVEACDIDRLLRTLGSCQGVTLWTKLSINSCKQDCERMTPSRESR
jgi:hypothetical protein